MGNLKFVMVKRLSVVFQAFSSTIQDTMASNTTGGTSTSMESNNESMNVRPNLDQKTTVSQVSLLLRVNCNMSWTSEEGEAISFVGLMGIFPGMPSENTVDKSLSFCSAIPCETDTGDMFSSLESRLSMSSIEVAKPGVSLHETGLPIHPPCFSKDFS